jgi:hypothetical protein
VYHMLRFCRFVRLLFAAVSGPNEAGEGLGSLFSLLEAAVLSGFFFVSIDPHGMNRYISNPVKSSLKYGDLFSYSAWFVPLLSIDLQA